LLPCGALHIRLGAAAGSQIGIVGGDNGRLLVVVAGIQDEGNGVPYPLIWLLRAEVIKDENFRREDRFE